MRYIIYPYKMGSASAKNLAEQLRADGKRVLRVYPNRSYLPRPNDVIVNWGSSTSPQWDCSRMLNKPAAVARAANKLLTFRALQGHTPTVEWTEEKWLAEEWIDGGSKVFARTTIISHSGNGIVVANTKEELVDAPLYTRGFNKTNEYRIHVFGDDVLDVQEKKRRSGTGGREGYDVWNHGNDFVFARENITPNEKVLESAVAAVKALDLDFGAVDVGWDGIQARVFEVNTACGLEGSTIRKYAEAIYVQDRR